jgi:hypothetical protein
MMMDEGIRYFNELLPWMLCIVARFTYTYGLIIREEKSSK